MIFNFKSSNVLNDSDINNFAVVRKSMYISYFMNRCKDIMYSLILNYYKINCIHFNTDYRTVFLFL